MFILSLMYGHNSLSYIFNPIIIYNNKTKQRGSEAGGRFNNVRDISRYSDVSYVAKASLFFFPSISTHGAQTQQLACDGQRATYL